MAGGEVPSSAVPEEDQAPPPVEEKKVPLRLYVDKLRDEMVKLDTEYEEMESGLAEKRAYAQEMLDQVDKYLTRLETQYQDDQEVYELRMMHLDLAGDLANNEDLELDHAWEMIMEDVQENIREAGVGQIEADEMEPGHLKDTYEQLRRAGIEPRYVVGNKGFPNAPVIILTAQIHHTSNMTEQQATASGVIDSQAVVEKVILSMLESGTTNAIYTEGIAAGETWDQDKAKQMLGRKPGNKFSSPLRLKAELGDQLELHGYEDEAMHGKVGASVKAAMKRGIASLFSSKNTNAIRARGAAGNIWIARNVAQGMQENGHDTAHVVLGRSHEINAASETHRLTPDSIIFGRGPHPLPISKLLAYEGFNVIVVDTKPPGHFS